MGTAQQHSTTIQTQKSSYRPITRSLTAHFTGLILILVSHQLNAQENQSSDNPLRPQREVIWSFDSSIMMFSKTLPDESKLEGLAGSFTVGYGRAKDNNWLCGRMHLLSGPWGTARNGAFDADYAGTMLDLEYGAALPATSLRSGSGIVLALAGGYLDLSGRNIGGNKNARDITSNSLFYLEQSFTTAVREIYLTPSIGWIWAKPSRPISNEQSQLNTRIEASSIKIGAMIPVYSRSRVTVTRRDDDGDISRQPQRRTVSGNTKGIAIVSSMNLWLGI